MNMHQLREFIAKQKQKILATGSPWSRLILISDHDPKRAALQQDLLADPKIAMLVERLHHPELGIKSLLSSPADYRVYGSFYWVLRFFADLGIAADQLGIQELIKILLWQQMEDGQFMIRYHRQKQQAISRVCLTAHLAYCLARLGYQQSDSVVAVVNYIVTTQRWDAGWHCDRLKQPGEKLENAPSCPSATVFVARLLGQFGAKYDAIIAHAIRSLLNVYPKAGFLECEFDQQAELNLSRLRYPPHYTGLDILNLLHSLSRFGHLIPRSDIDRLIEPILKRWDGDRLLRSEKRIPEWSGFDFARNQAESDWITSLFIQAIETMELNDLEAE